MKKFLSFILALTFCFAAFSAFAPTVAAKSATIDKKEAKELVEQAMDFFYDARVEGYNEDIVDHKSGDRRKVYYPEYDLNVTYLPVYEAKLPGGSYSAMCEIAKQIYSEDIASDSYNLEIYQKSDGSIEKYSRFYLDDNGKVFANYFPEYGYIFIDDDIPNIIQNIKGDSSAASAIVAIKSYWSDGPRPYYYFPVECKFVNTADGWRIAESEYSILLASDSNYLDTYREENSEKVRDEALEIIDVEAKYIVDQLISSISLIYGYKQYYYDYTQTNGEEFVSISKEIITDKGEKKTIQYFKLIHFGWIIGYGESEETIMCYVTESAYKLFERAYADEDFATMIMEGGDYYIAAPETVNFAYDPETAVVKVIKSTDKEATALVYCYLIKDGEMIPIVVECKFEKFYTRWYITESPFVDMITSADEFEYTVAEAPKTGDRALDTIALCLGGIAIIMSALCLVRRKREIL